MFKHLIIGIIATCIAACQLNENAITPVELKEDSTLVLMDSIGKKPLFTINSFSQTPDSIAECQCHFSITKNVFKAEQYIFKGKVDTIGALSYMQMDSRWVLLALSDITNVGDSLSINVSNDSIIVGIRAIQDSIDATNNIYKGEIRIDKLNKDQQFLSDIYGTCEI